MNISHEYYTNGSFCIAAIIKKAQNSNAITTSYDLYVFLLTLFNSSSMLDIRKALSRQMTQCKDTQCQFN